VVLERQPGDPELRAVNAPCCRNSLPRRVDGRPDRSNFKRRPSGLREPSTGEEQDSNSDFSDAHILPKRVLNDRRKRCVILPSKNDWQRFEELKRLVPVHYSANISHHGRTTSGTSRHHSTEIAPCWGLHAFIWKEKLLL